MKNTLLTSFTKNLIIAFFVIVCAESGCLSQEIQNSFTNSKFDKKRLIDLRIKKTGPFIGVEKGRYLNISVGGEYQHSLLRIRKPKTHAFNFQLDYNFRQNVLGAQLGSWYKQGRLGITYGGRITWIHDLVADHRFGISPNIGYKFLQAHLQFGVNLRTHSTTFENVNVFYASLRWVFINDRNIENKGRRVVFGKEN
jgi:hypothetical protein